MSHLAPPSKIPNCQKRSREHLFPQEVDAMIKAAQKTGRHGLRDSTLILMAYRHGLRVSEFVSEYGTVMASATARGIIERAGKVARLPISVHPHMLRHACGFYLACKGFDTRAIQAYLGHKNIQHTVRYTEMSAKRFQDFWLD